MSDAGHRAKPSEFDLRPSERKLRCGCYVEEIGDTWRITGQAFLCPDKHKFHAALASEIVEHETVHTATQPDSLPPLAGGSR